MNIRVAFKYSLHFQAILGLAKLGAAPAGIGRRRRRRSLKNKINKNCMHKSDHPIPQVQETTSKLFVTIFKGN
jgi:hypothetical protein